MTTANLETATALDLVMASPGASQYSAYVGLGVHKATIAVAIAPEGRDAPEYHGEIANKPKNIVRLVVG